MQQELPLGTKLKDGDFRIGKLLKKECFSITYMGSNAKLQKPVVIKEFFPEGCTRNQYGIQPSDLIKNNYQEIKNKFLNEGRILSELNHPSIVVYECFEENNTVYIISEYLLSKTLLELLESNGYLPEEEAISYIKQVGETLAILHETNLLHLDIKPENIFLTEDLRVVLTEFGEAKQEAERKRLIQQIGLNSSNLDIPKTLTHGYAAKELYYIGEKLGTYTDIYALAATGYHLLSGKIPTPAIKRSKGEELTPLSDIRNDISSVTNSPIMKGLEIEAQERIQSVGDFLALFNTNNQRQIIQTNHQQQTIQSEIIEPENPEQKLINSLANFCVELEQAFDTFCELLVNFLNIDPRAFEDKNFAQQLREKANLLQLKQNQNQIYGTFIQKIADEFPTDDFSKKDWYTSIEPIERLFKWLKESGVKDVAKLYSKLLKKLFLKVLLQGNYSLIEKIQHYGDFIAQIMNALHNSGSAKVVVYPLLRSKRQNLDYNLVEVLQILWETMIPEVSEEVRKEMGHKILEFSDLIQDFPEGNNNINIEIAITGWEIITPVFPVKYYKQQGGKIQLNRGLAYLQRTQGYQSNNLQTAIECFNDALEAYTYEEYPQEWITIQTNLGIAYREHTLFNFSKAVEHFSAVLEKYGNRRDRQWANIKNELGRTYLKQAEKSFSNKEKNLSEALSCFNEAFKIYSQQTFCQEYLQTQLLRGRAYQATGDLDDAMIVYGSAIKQIESLGFENLRISERDKQEFARKWNYLYQVMVETCMKNKKYPKAIEYVERSKAGTLIELIASLNLSPKNIIDDEIREQLNELQRDIAEERTNISKTSDLETIDYSNLFSLRQKLDSVIAKHILPIEPSFSLQMRKKSIKLESIKELISDRYTAIIEWYITDENIYTFIITKDKLELLELNDLKQAFEYCKELYKVTYQQQIEDEKNEWQDNLKTHLEKLAEVLNIRKIIEKIPNCRKLILIPHGFLHTIPLHALILDYKEGSYLIDRFMEGISYAPSCQLLQLTKEWQRENFHNLFAVQNPSTDLNYSDQEVEIIKKYFDKSDIYQKENATKASICKTEANKLEEAHCVHFSCHSNFNFDSPLDSALTLADGKLNLQEILKLNLKQCRLVTLSACETGLIDDESSTDEYVSLSSAFLYAGSPSVVASLWKVNDFSSTLLMIKFYEYMSNDFRTNQTIKVANALNEAQRWLRRETQKDLHNWIQKLKLEPYIKDLWEQELISLCEKQNISSQSRPFSDPYYWAGFCAIGQ